MQEVALPVGRHQNVGDMFYAIFAHGSNNCDAKIRLNIIVSAWTVVVNTCDDTYQAWFSGEYDILILD